MICERQAGAFRARAAAASLPSIAFNLLAQTSQLAARINLGSPLSRGSKGGQQEENEQVDRGERAAEAESEEPRDGKGRQSADHVADGRRSVARAGNGTLYGQCDESGKTDPQSRQPRPRRPRRLIPYPLAPSFLFVAAVAGPNASTVAVPGPSPPSPRASTRSRSSRCTPCIFRWTRNHSPFPFSFCLASTRVN